MSHKYWLSDHHFGHDNIVNLESENRPFKDSQEMGQWLVAQHNSRCTKQDHIYCGGDFAVGKNARDALTQFAPQMNGTLHLILGNHDDLDLDTYLRFFKTVKVLKAVTVNGDKLWVTHVPIHPSELQYRVAGNIHGHLHSNIVPDDKYYNMCVEHWDGIPRTAEEIVTLS